MNRERNASIIVIKNGVLIDGTEAYPKRECIVMVKGARISNVGKENDVKIPKAKVTEVDASGMTVMPGLVDAHLHLTGPKTNNYWEETLVRPPQLGLIKSVYDAIALLEAGFTTVKDCGGFGIYLKKAIAEGTTRGPRILSAGYALSQTGGHGDVHFLPIEWVDVRISRKSMSLLRNGALICDGVAECIKAARYALREGADFIKVMASGGVGSMGDRPEHTQFTLEELKAIVEEARRAGKFVTAHCHGAEAIKNCIKAGVKTVDHASYSDDETIEMAKKRKDVIFVPTLSCMYPINAREEEKYESPSWIESKMMEVKKIYTKNVSKLYRAGLTIAIGTDFDGCPRHPMGANSMELELLVKECGFKPVDAIIAATRNGAKACGLENEIGTIEKGKLADIIIVDGDPLNDIKVLRDKNKIKMVIKEGKIEVNRGLKVLNNL